MTNLTLGSGDEENGRPLLGGLGALQDSGSRGGVGASGTLLSPVIETIARIARIVSGGGSGGGAGGCSWVEAKLPSGQRVGDCQPGDWLHALTEDGMAWTDYHAHAVRSSMQPCFRIVSESGIELTCSASTPLTTRMEGELRCVGLGIGVLVPVWDERGFRWEEIDRMEPVGELPVNLIDCGGGTFASGDAPGRFIFTHNKLDTPPDDPG